MQHHFNDHYMHLALKEAQKAYLKNEVPVGCIITHQKSNKIIARAHNLVETTNNPLAHAELLAINTACEQLKSKNLKDCDIYVTLEPCTLCSAAISFSRLNRLYYGAFDRKQGAIEHNIRFFNHQACLHRPEIYSGILAKRSSLLLSGFFCKLRIGK